MRFSFSRAEAPPPAKPDRLRQEIARLGSEAAVISAACSSIADAHRKQMELIDAGIASSGQIARGLESTVQAASADSGGGSLQAVADQAQQLTAAVAQLAASVTEVVRANEATRQRADDLAAAAEHTSRSIAMIIASTEQLAAGSPAQSDQDSVARAIDGIEGVKDAMDGSAAAARELDARVDGFRDLIDAVKAMAERAHLLSLNAAIEAAHAGDAGRGFVVIAEELRALAERADRTTADVTSVVQGLRAVTSAQVASASARQELVQRVASIGDEGRAALARIVAGVAHGADATRQASSAARETLSAGQEVISQSGELRSSAIEQGRAVADLDKAADIARRAAASTSRRLKEQASAAAQAATEMDALARAASEAQSLARTLAELRALAERTARSAHDSSTVSASLQQRVSALS